MVGTFKYKIDEKINAEEDYENLIIHFYSIKLIQPVKKKWKINVSINKIKSIPIENPPINPENAILSTLENYVITYHDILENRGYVFFTNSVTQAYVTKKIYVRKFQIHEK